MWPQLVMTGACSAALLGSLSAAFSTHYAISRAYNFTLAAAFAIGGFSVVLLAPLRNEPLLIAIGATMGALCLATCEVGLFTSSRRHNASPVGELIASLGLYIALIHVIALLFGHDHQIPRSGPRPTFSVLGGSLTHFQFWTLILLLAVIAVYLLWIYRTTSGMMIRAFADNNVLAHALGFPMRQLSILAALAVGSIFGLGGAITCLNTGIAPDSSFRPFLLAAVAAIFGRPGAIATATIGGFILGMSLELAVAFIPNAWTDSLAFGLFLFAILLRPLERIVQGTYLE